MINMTVLLTEQTDPIENGVYVLHWNFPATSSCLVRSSGYDTGDSVYPGHSVYVWGGDSAGSTWSAWGSATPLVVDTDDSYWARQEQSVGADDVVGILPVYHGGTGTWDLTCDSGEFLTSDGTAFRCEALPLAAGLPLSVSNGGTGSASLTAGSLVVGAGTSAPTGVAPGANGNVLQSVGGSWASAPSAANSSAYFSRIPFWWRWTKVTGSGATVLGVGTPSPTCSRCDIGSNAVFGTTPIASGAYLPVGAGNGDAQKVFSTVDTTMPGLDPSMSFVLQNQNASTSRRIWACVGASADPSGSAAPAASLLCLRYDTSVSDSTWKCCAGNGTTTTCTDTGVAIAVNNTQVLAVSYANGTGLTCSVSGTSVLHSSTLPAYNSVMGATISMTSLASGSVGDRGMIVGNVAFSQK